ncbi:hypothetical protein AGMMS49944_25480 [Spirochaetia bacterium]|nr:hypothetical protein AGMMS49944_25480 [Spirochaetia bacterium]
MPNVEQTGRAIWKKWEDIIRTGEELPGPEVEMDDSSLSTIKEIEKLRDFLNFLENTVKDDPEEIETVNLILKRMSDAKDTEEKWIQDMIDSGESQMVEFKETLMVPVIPKEVSEKLKPEVLQQKKKEMKKVLEEEVLKNIVAFLNTGGGYLFIGIRDNKEIIGIQNELDQLKLENPKWNTDHYLLHISTLIGNQIGVEFSSFIKYAPVLVKGKTILKIECTRSSKPCYLNEELFFIRSGPETKQLKGEKVDSWKEINFK